MKKNVVRLTLFAAILAFLPAHRMLAQLSCGGIPPSIAYSMQQDEHNRILVSKPDLGPIQREDEQFPSPYRFTIVLPVDISPENSGAWESVPGGGRIWRVSVDAPGALAVSAYFDSFQIPEGGKLFLYNRGRTQVIGAFTALNNVNHGYFATELIQGEELCLEYYQPGETKMLPQIHMYGMDYAYRGVEFLDGYRTTGESRGICEVNVNCPEGSNWQEEKKGVNRIKIMKGGSGYWCTGSLVNNVRGDFMPYILTADHCGYGASTADLQQWIFYFGYEAATCQGITSTSKSLTGATLKAHGGSQGDTGSDFYLVKLDQKIPDTFDVVFNGWNRKDTTSPSGVCIHHPWGDIKKISTYNVPLTTAIYGGNPNPCFWEVSWIQTTNGHGVTEPGSSGSPLLDNFGRIVGTLTGGDSSCDSAYLDSPDYYGKFSWSWSSDGVDSTARLMDWLDPDHTGIMSLDKLTMGVTEHPHPIIVKIFPNPFTDFITLEIQGAHSSAAAMEVVDLLGVTRWSGTLPVLKGAPVSVSLTGLASGMYILRLHADGSVTTLKMIKK